MFNHQDGSVKGSMSLQKIRFTGQPASIHATFENAPQFTEEVVKAGKQ